MFLSREEEKGLIVKDPVTGGIVRSYSPLHFICPQYSEERQENMIYEA